MITRDKEREHVPNATTFYRRCGYQREAEGIYTLPSGLELACTPMHKRLTGYAWQG
jgi:hypothetical protein